MFLRPSLEWKLLILLGVLSLPLAPFGPQNLAQTAEAACAQNPSTDDGVPSWHVGTGKFLLMTCHFGRISNQVMCLKRSLTVAALLNRSLLLPPQGISIFNGAPAYHWSWELVLDWERTNKCLETEHGSEVVLPLLKYLHQRGGSTVTLDKVHCLAPGQSTNCFKPWVLKELLEANKPYLSFPPIDNISQWLKPTSLPEGHRVISPEAITRHLGGVTDEVLCAGELFGVVMPPAVTQQMLASSSPSCSNMWRPHPAVLSFVEGFIASALQAPYASLHLRRGDFYMEYMKKRRKRMVLQRTSEGAQKPGNGGTYTEYKPIAEVAGMLREKLANAPHLDTLFVATDAGPVEFQILRQLLLDPRVGRNFTNVVSLRHLEKEKGWLERQEWAEQLLGFEGTSSHQLGLVLADKWICARAEVFVGTEWSTFTKDIANIRMDEKLTSPMDSKLSYC